MKTIAVLAMLVLGLSGTPATAQVLVAADVTDDATEANSQPKIGQDGHGETLVTFVKPAGGFSQIFVASSTDGRRWDLQQISRATAHARYPTLAVGPNNIVHIAWTQYDNGVGKVYYSRHTDTGWSAPVKVSPGDAYAGVPALAVDAQGTVHMVWYGIRAQAPVITTRHGSTYEILYTAARAGHWQAPILISPGIPDSVNAGLAIDTDGRLHSAWYQFDLRNYQVRYTRYEQAWLRPQTISVGRADSMAVTLAAGPHGTVALAWERRDAEGSHIYFADRTEHWSEQQQISLPSQMAFNPSLAIDARDRLFAAWDSGGQIYLRRRDDRWLETSQVSKNGQNTHPVLAALRGTVLLMWTHQGADKIRVVQVMRADGASLPPTPSRSPSTLVLASSIAAGLAVLWAVQRQRRRPVA